MTRLVGHLALLCALTGAAPALAQDYRRIELAQGGSLVGEMLATESDGIRIRLGQGEMLVSFDDLRDLLPSDAFTFEGQAPWRVLLRADGPAEDLLASAIASMPGVVRIPRGELDALVLAGMDACGDDLACVGGVIESFSWTWVVDGRVDEAGTLAITTARGHRVEAARIEGALPAEGARKASRTGEEVGAELVAAMEQTLWLQPSGTPASAGVLESLDRVRGGRAPAPVKPPTEPREERSFTRGRAIALSFVPVPGMPSWVRGDYAGGGMALGSVVAGTALWVGATGEIASSRTEHAVIGAVGSYALTVVANGAFGLRPMARRPLAVGVGPLGSGEGAMVTLGGTLR